MLFSGETEYSLRCTISLDRICILNIVHSCHSCSRHILPKHNKGTYRGLSSCGRLNAHQDQSFAISMSISPSVRHVSECVRTIAQTEVILTFRKAHFISLFEVYCHPYHAQLAASNFTKRETPTLLKKAFKRRYFQSYGQNGFSLLENFDTSDSIFNHKLSDKPKLNHVLKVQVPKNFIKF
jgi:hypothetical protein